MSEQLFTAIGQAAEAWQDPDYGPRDDAVNQTVSHDNRFTEEALAFAINQQMHLLTADRLQQWIGGRTAREQRIVGVLHPGNVPLAGLQDMLAVILTGHRYVGRPSSRSPVLIPRFLDEIKSHVDSLEAMHVETTDELLSRAEAVIASGSDETTEWVVDEAEEFGISREHLLLRGSSYAMAVVDGEENEEERSGLAEDILLHEGRGCRNVALLWAPRDQTPDPYLDMMAQFRDLFPPHESTNGTLSIPQAFLEATDQPHAYGRGILISRGPAEIRRPGHVRWTEYDSIDEVRTYIADNREDIQLVVAAKRVQRELRTDLPVVEPGNAQRPELGWCPDGIDTVDWLCQL